MEKRIFGATDGIRGKVGEAPLRPNIVRELGRAIAKNTYAKKVLLGRDTRVSGVWMGAEISDGLKAMDVDVEDFGILPTPAVQAIIRDSGEYDAGIMLTASHNPATDNGIKVFGSDGDKISDEQELSVEATFFEAKLEKDEDAPEVRFVKQHSEAAEKYYEQIAAAQVGDMGFDGMKVLLDAASGAGHDFSRKVFEEFALEVEQIDPEPNGQNINDGYGALYPEKLAEATHEQGLIGIALDGDADRIVLADEDGRIWDGDRIVILLAEYLKEQGKLPADTVVLTEYSNLATIKYLENEGIKVAKVVNGDRYVAQKCVELGAGLGGELAGHIIYLPWLRGSDGTFMALMVLRIVQESGKRLADMWADYENLPSRQWGLFVKEKRPLEEIKGFSEAVAEAEERFAGKGRVFVRYSGTENKIRVLVEGEDEALVDEIGEGLVEIIKKEIGA
ncbi:phosphoglucosamine mutase [Candidatus Saccharibacteria bacterium]|nr:phosphoglucosamine mutase [Candidatus Saccharibacteria bacterium]